MLEGVYQNHIIQTLDSMFPGCVVIKNDSGYRQGFPDLTVLYGPAWGVLEVKTSAKAKYQPNQEYYLELLNGMSFASVIYPEIEEEVLSALQSAFAPERQAFSPERQQGRVGQLQRR